MLSIPPWRCEVRVIPPFPVAVALGLRHLRSRFKSSLCLLPAEFSAYWVAEILSNARDEIKRIPDGYGSKNDRTCCEKPEKQTACCVGVNVKCN